VCSAHANALQIVTVTFCMKLLQNGRLVRFSKRTDCRYAFSWSIGRQSGQLIWLIQSSRSEGYDSIHKSWEDIISCEEQWPKPKTKWNGSPTLKRTVSKNHKITAANVTVELKIHLEDTFSTKTVWRELHKSNIHVTAATAQPLIIKKKNTKKRKRCSDDRKKFDAWWLEIRNMVRGVVLQVVTSIRQGWCWKTLKEPYDPECLVRTTKHGGGSVMIWAAISWHSTGLRITLKGQITAIDYGDALVNSCILLSRCYS